MPPRVTEAHLQARREQILTAAVCSFAKSGLHAATLQDIANEAELSAGALYRYFASKKEIIESMAAESRRNNAAAFESVRQEGDTARALSAQCVAFFYPVAGSRRSRKLARRGQSLVRGRLFQRATEG